MASNLTKQQIKDYLTHKIEMLSIECEIMNLDIIEKKLNQPVPDGTFSLKNLVEHNKAVSDFQFKLGFEKGRLEVIKEFIKDFNI